METARFLFVVEVEEKLESATTCLRPHLATASRRAASSDALAASGDDGQQRLLIPRRASGAAEVEASGARGRQDELGSVVIVVVVVVVGRSTLQKSLARLGPAYGSLSYPREGIEDGHESRSSCSEREVSVVRFLFLEGEKKSGIEIRKK